MNETRGSWGSSRPSARRRTNASRTIVYARRSRSSSFRILAFLRVVTVAPAPPAPPPRPLEATPRASRPASRARARPNPPPRFAPRSRPPPPPPPPPRRARLLLPPPPLPLRRRLERRLEAPHLRLRALVPGVRALLQRRPARPELLLRLLHDRGLPRDPLRAVLAPFPRARHDPLAVARGARGAALRAGDGAARIVGVAGPLEVFALLPPGAPPRAVLELARGDPERDVAVARRGEAHGGLGLSTSSRIAARGRRLDRLEVPPPERALVRGPVGAHDRARVHVVLRVEPAGVQRARAAARPARRRARAAAPRAHAAAGRGRRAERVHEGRRRRRGPAGVRSRARRGGTGTRGVRRRRERDDATTRAGGLESAGRTRGARARGRARAARAPTRTPTPSRARAGVKRSRRRGGGRTR